MIVDGMTRRIRTGLLGLWLLPALLLPAGGLSELCLCLKMLAFAPCCAQVEPAGSVDAAAPTGCCSSDFAEEPRSAPSRDAPIAEHPDDDGPCTVIATPRSEPATPPAEPFELPEVDVLAYALPRTAHVAIPNATARRDGGARAPPRGPRLCLRPGALPLRI